MWTDLRASLRRYPLGLGWLCLGCAPEAVGVAPTAGDSGGPDSAVEATCGEVRFSVVQAWEEADLPTWDPGDRISPGVAIADLDGDGWPDLLMAYGRGSMILLNDGTGRFVPGPTDVLSGGPLPGAGSVATADLDGDGDEDAWLGRRDGPDLLLFNEGPNSCGGGESGRDSNSGLRFRAVEVEESDHKPWTGSFGDLDLDGDLDLIVGTFAADFDPAAIITTGATGAGMAVHLQTEPGVLHKLPGAIPEEALASLNLQPTLLDADQDGDLDVYLANDFGPYVVPNRLLLNDGTGRFTRAPDCACELSMFAMGAGTGDANGDGLPDLFISNVGMPALLLGLGDGSFYDATLASGAAIPPTASNMTSWGTAFADMTLDGCEDLLIGYGNLSESFDVSTLETAGADWEDGPVQNDVLLRGDCEGGFERWDEAGFTEPGRSRALAVGDLNRDGRPDIVTVGKHFLHVWMAEGGCPALRLRLDGGPGNRPGIGARVQAWSEGRPQTKWMLPATTASSSQAELYFSSRSVFERIEVTWPGGAVSEVSDVPPGDELRMVR